MNEEQKSELKNWLRLTYYLAFGDKESMCVIGNKQREDWLWISKQVRAKFFSEYPLNN